MTRGQEKAAPLCQTLDLSEASGKLLDDQVTAAQYLVRLCKQELYADAVKFLAHLLTKQEAVWWGCLCVWQRRRPEPAPAEGAALHAAVCWVLDPSEANRRAAEEPGRAVGAARPAGALALAAFWSGGSMTAPELPPVPVPQSLTARTVAGAILSAAAEGDPAQRVQRYRQFLQLGIEVFSGTSRWQKGGPAS